MPIIEWKINKPCKGTKTCLPFSCMWLIAAITSSTISIVQASELYSVWKDFVSAIFNKALALGPPYSWTPAHRSIYNSHVLILLLWWSSDTDTYTLDRKLCNKIKPSRWSSATSSSSPLFPDKSLCTRRVS